MTSAPVTCSNCLTTKSPLWRRCPLNKVLCNACGLYLRNHGSMRPLMLQVAQDNYKEPKAVQSPKSSAHSSSVNSPQPSLKTIKFGKNSLNTTSNLSVHHQRKGQGAENQPKRLSSQPSWTLPVLIHESDQGKELKSMLYRGRYYHVGDGVIVYGSDEKQYFGIITNLFVNEYGSKFFNLRWLLPKADVLQISKERSLLPTDFYLGPDHPNAENMECIVDVIFSQPAFNFYTPPLTPVESPMKPELFDKPHPHSHSQYTSDDFEVAELLVSFNKDKFCNK